MAPPEALKTTVATQVDGDPNHSPPIPSPALKKQSGPNTNGSSRQAARERFEDVYVVIREELLEHFRRAGMPDDACEWFKRNLDYNVPGGKLNRGLSVVDSVQILKGRQLTDAEYLKAAVLGWCVELLQSYFLVADDMMDQSITRRGHPCWFRNESVGNIAINDSFMLEAAIYHLLKSHFRREPYYVELLDIFHETTYQTEMGQLVDLITAPEDIVDLNKFTLGKHRFIVIYKTAYYSFYLPVALAMHMCGIPSTSSLDTLLPSIESASAPASDPYQLALQILIPLGEYFQVQDDFLDFSGTPEQIGKIGTDIIDNKCSWCVNTALAVATPEQRAVLDENYGRKDWEKEKKVKALYEEMDIRGRYKTYEESAYARIMHLIEAIPETNVAVTNGNGTGYVNGNAERPVTLKREVFKSFLDKIYKRTK